MTKLAAQANVAKLASRTLAISRYTLIEAWRNRIAWLFLGVVMVSILVSLFLREQALTEANRVQAAALASMMRIGSVFVVTLYVLHASVREFQDKILELMLSLELPRGSYLTGKLLGYITISAACAAIASLPLLALASPQNVLMWAYTHMLELWIVAAFALFCITTFSQFLPAATLTLAFYVLARSISAIQLISQSTLTPESIATEFGKLLADAVALVLPRLDAFAQTAWLTNSTPTDLSAVSATAQAAIYVLLLLSAAMFDLHRRNI